MLKLEKFNSSEFLGLSMAIGGQGPIIVHKVSITTNRSGDDNQRQDAPERAEIPSVKQAPTSVVTCA